MSPRAAASLVILANCRVNGQQLRGCNAGMACAEWGHHDNVAGRHFHNNVLIAMIMRACAVGGKMSQPSLSPSFPCCQIMELKQLSQ